MISAEVSLEHIFEFYNEVNRLNVIKLLLRCKKLYEARVDVKKILLLIIKKEEIFKWINYRIELNNTSKKAKVNNEEAQRIYDGVRFLQRLISSISQFKHEHKVFKGQFIFKGKDYQEVLQNEMERLQLFIEANDIHEFGVN